METKTSMNKVDAVVRAWCNLGPKYPVCVEAMGKKTPNFACFLHSVNFEGS